MTLFVISSAILLGLILVWIGRPLWSQQNKTAISQTQQSESNKTALQTQLAEAKQELEAGRIEPAAFEETEAELAQRLLEETTAQSTVESTTGPAMGAHAKQPWVFAATGLFVVTFAVGLYSYLGQADLISGNNSETNNASTELSASEAQQKVAQLRQQLEAEPENAAAWAALARLERRLGNTAEAAFSYQYAQRLTNDDASKTELQLEMVETFVLHAERSGGGIPPMALKMTNQILERHPEHPRALWYGAMLADSAGQRGLAVERLQILLKMNPPEQIRQALNKQLDAWQAAPALNPAPAPASAPAAEENVANISSREITIQIDIPSHLDIGNTNAATLFVYAKAVGTSTIPLAVWRHDAPIFPLQATLNDSMAMIAGTQLGSYEQLEITARISFSGDAISQPGDWYGSQQIGKTENDVIIAIDRLVE